MSGVLAVCSLCGWAQGCDSMTDSDWLHSTHNHDAHDGPPLWSTATSSLWEPPSYLADARDGEAL